MHFELLTVFAGIGFLSRGKISSLVRTLLVHLMAEIITHLSFICSLFKLFYQNSGFMSPPQVPYGEKPSASSNKTQNPRLFATGNRDSSGRGPSTVE